MENTILDPNLIFSAGAEIINEKKQKYNELSKIIIEKILALTKNRKFSVSEIVTYEYLNKIKLYKYSYIVDITEIRNKNYHLTMVDIPEVIKYITDNISNCYRHFSIAYDEYDDDGMVITFELVDPTSPHIK